MFTYNTDVKGIKCRVIEFNAEKRDAINTGFFGTDEPKGGVERPEPDRFVKSIRREGRERVSDTKGGGKIFKGGFRDRSKLREWEGGVS